jgi:hypothetical protein
MNQLRRSVMRRVHARASSRVWCARARVHAYVCARYACVRVCTSVYRRACVRVWVPGGARRA